MLQVTKIYIELSVGMCYYKIHDQTEEKGMKIAVCDDDRLLTGEIDSQLQKIREKTGISFETDIFFDGETLWEAIEKNGSYDVVYLDIEMKNMDGITVARKIRERDPYAILIFISSYDSYYEQLFEVEPLRFLHKPIDPKKFDEYFLVAYTKLTSLEDRLHFEFNKRLYQIPYRDIVYMESRRRVIHLFGRNGEEYRFYKKMKDLLEEISHTGNMFIRVHCSYVVNYYYIKSLSSTEAELLTGEKLPVSGEYKNEALKKLDCILCRFVTSYDRTCYNLIRNVSLICKIFKFSLRFRDPIYSGISGCYNPLKYFDIQIICKKGG